MPGLTSSFNMDKIIKENNKKLNRFTTDELQFDDMIVEETDLDLPEIEEM